MDEAADSDPNEQAFQEELRRVKEAPASQPYVAPELAAIELFKSPVGRGELDRLCDSRIEQWYMRDLERLRVCAKAIRYLIDTGKM
ncbi:MAG TPA: hypothetical protein VFW23_16800 [Tepidisphaeraceae bacterium]|nr:hypothetical protein [Tepidisphaeraceae bacterium]